MSTGLLSSMRQGRVKDVSRKEETALHSGKKIHTKSTLPDEIAHDAFVGRGLLQLYSISSLPRTNTQPKFLQGSASTIRVDRARQVRAGCRLLRPQPRLSRVAAKSDVDESLDDGAELDLARDRAGFTFLSRGPDSQHEHPPTLTTNEKRDETLNLEKPRGRNRVIAAIKKVVAPQTMPYSNVLSHTQSLRHILNEKVSRPVTLNERDIFELGSQGRPFHPAKPILKKSAALGRNGALKSGSVRSVGLSLQSGGGSSRRCVTFSRNKLVLVFQKNESSEELEI